MPVWGCVRLTKDADIKALLSRERADVLIGILKSDYRADAQIKKVVDIKKG